ncbi:hypothetical protein N9L68_00240 [bacterium]|nr:hypothetical protein [bacterium]
MCRLRDHECGACGLAAEEEYKDAPIAGGTADKAHSHSNRTTQLANDGTQNDTRSAMPRPRAFACDSPGPRPPRDSGGGVRAHGWAHEGAHGWAHVTGKRSHVRSITDLITALRALPG